MKRLRKYIDAHRKTFGLAGVVIALAVAVAYFIVVPESASGANGLKKFILLYSHGLCWLLLSAASGSWAFRGANKWSSGMLYAALVLYAAFIVSILI